VNLRSRLLIMGCLFVIVQILVLFLFSYYYVVPKTAKLEKSLVEKNLHRGLELLQRELFHLEHVTKILSQQPLLQQLVNSSSSPDTASADRLQEQMLHQELNLMYILDGKDKVVWEDILDLSTERPYPKQPFLTSLWETRAAFLNHPSMLSLQAGIFNSTLGPMFVVSAPIASSATSSKVQGTLIVGRLITQDVIHLIQSLSYTDSKLWPLGGATLNEKQRDIIQQLLQGDSDFMTEQSPDLLRGYMFLQDLNNQPNLLISSTQTRDFSQTMQLSMTDIGCIFIALQILFLFIVYFLIRSTLLKPTRQLIKQLNNPRQDWRPLQVDIKPWNEMGLLASAISNLISRHQDHLSQETSVAFREGIYQARQNLYQDLEDTLKPVIEGIEITEKKLSNLPTNDIEWIIAEGKTGQISQEKLSEYTKKLQIINEKLRYFQKETRHRLSDLYAKTLRNAAAIRAQARSLDTIREFTPTSNGKKKTSMARS